MRKGDRAEAYWLLFLAVHFGKHSRFGWSYVRAVYGRLDAGRWDWRAASSDPKALRAWLRANQSHIRAAGGGFGNHRKYQSLRDDAPTGTGPVIESYVEWTTAGGGHETLVGNALRVANGDAAVAFDEMYRSMGVVLGFGRTARFDYLSMVGNVGLARLQPGRAYLSGATGPLRGARLLFKAPGRAAFELEQQLARLDDYLRVGMQALEDALCNWQKSPDVFVAYRG